MKHSLPVSRLIEQPSGFVYAKTRREQAIALEGDRLSPVEQRPSNSDAEACGAIAAESGKALPIS